MSLTSLNYGTITRQIGPRWIPVLMPDIDAIDYFSVIIDGTHSSLYQPNFLPTWWETRRRDPKRLASLWRPFPHYDRLLSPWSAQLHPPAKSRPRVRCISFPFHLESAVPDAQHGTTERRFRPTK